MRLGHMFLLKTCIEFCFSGGMGGETSGATRGEVHLCLEQWHPQEEIRRVLGFEVSIVALLDGPIFEKQLYDHMVFLQASL